jgi:Ca2+-binding EF-hand superfamily protein
MNAEFTKLDTNKDGQLSKAEFMAAAPALQQRTTPQQFITALDTNKDGKVSLQELQARPVAAFNKLDTNHDGTVTAAELQAARQQKK